MRLRDPPRRSSLRWRTSEKVIWGILLPLDTLLQRYVGWSIKDVGDLDLSFTLQDTPTQRSPKWFLAAYREANEIENDGRARLSTLRCHFRCIYFAVFPSDIFLGTFSRLWPRKECNIFFTMTFIVHRESEKVASLLFRLTNFVHHKVSVIF